MIDLRSRIAMGELQLSKSGNIVSQYTGVNAEIFALEVPSTPPLSLSYFPIWGCTLLCPKAARIFPAAYSGQRQRIMITRALVLKARILIFDEATSALDNETQRIVTESLSTLKVTRIAVAHRLSTIRGADRMYVIEKGRVVQAGTNDTLIQEPGLLAQLMKRQTV
jgi:hypothetical protein